MQGNDDFLTVGGRYDQARVIRGERQPAATSIDEDSELDFGGAAMVEQFIQCRFDGTPREQNIIDQNDGRAIHIDGDLGGSELLGDGIAPDVIAMERNIECTDPRILEFGADPLSEENSAIGDTQEEKLGIRWVTLSYAGDKTLDRGLNVGRRDTFRCRHENPLCPLAACKGRNFAGKVASSG